MTEPWYGVRGLWSAVRGPASLQSRRLLRHYGERWQSASGLPVRGRHADRRHRLGWARSTGVVFRDVSDYFGLFRLVSPYFGIRGKIFYSATPVVQLAEQGGGSG